MTSSAPQPRSAFLVVGAFILAIGLNVGYTTWAVGEGRAAQQQQAREADAKQRQQGQVVEVKLCTTLGKLAALEPPAGNPGRNPSRAFDDRLHATLDQLGPDIGCQG